MPSQRWKKYPKRLLDEITATSGAVGLAGIGLTVVGSIAAAPIAATMGGFVLGGAFIWAATRAIPPRLIRPEILIGKELKLNELDQIDPALKRVGFIGAPRAGKSTLLDHLRHVEVRNTVTEEVYAVIIILQTMPATQFVLIDGAGQQYAQQFKVAEKSDILFIFLDHDSGDSKIVFTKERLTEHRYFIGQLRHYIKHNRATPRIHFLLNKSDAWEKGPKQKVEELALWFKSIVQDWQESYSSNQVTFSTHSNRKSDNITLLIQLLISLQK